MGSPEYRKYIHYGSIQRLSYHMKQISHGKRFLYELGFPKQIRILGEQVKNGLYIRGKLKG